MGSGKLLVKQKATFEESELVGLSLTLDDQPGQSILDLN